MLRLKKLPRLIFVFKKIYHFENLWLFEPEHRVIQCPVVGVVDEIGNIVGHVDKRVVISLELAIFSQQSNQR